MQDGAYDTIRILPRQELEALALRMALHIRALRGEAEHGRVFAATLTGFVTGALVATVGFLLGAGFG